MYDDHSPTVDQVRQRAADLYAEQRARRVEDNPYADVAAHEHDLARERYAVPRVVAAAGPEAFGRRSLPGRHVQSGTADGPTATDARARAAEYRAEASRRAVFTPPPAPVVSDDFWGQRLAAGRPVANPRNRSLIPDVLE